VKSPLPRKNGTAGNQSPRRGFTLIEIVVAMMILLLLLFSFGYLIFLSSIRARASANRDTAVTVAKNVMEKIKNLDWNSVAKERTFDGLQKPPDTPVRAGTDTQYPPSPYPTTDVDNKYKSAPSGNEVSHITTYHCVVKSFYDPEFPTSQDLLYLVVDVYWKESGGGGGFYQKSISLTSAILKKD
jgi:prepilin-type N-terminal cleavage/methylation domain-containing protein